LDFLQNDYPSEWRLFMIRPMRLLPLVCLTLLIQQPSSFASASGPGSSTTQAAAGQAAAGGQQKAGGSQSGGPSAASQPSSSNAYFESQMLAYGAMTQLSANIAARVCSELTNSQPLVMFDRPRLERGERIQLLRRIGRKRTGDRVSSQQHELCISVHNAGFRVHFEHHQSNRVKMS
jgi:hypothetical protein